MVVAMWRNLGVWFGLIAGGAPLKGPGRGRGLIARLAGGLRGAARGDGVRPSGAGGAVGRRGGFLVVIAAALWVFIAGPAVARQPLADNPALVQGVLGNGARYVVVRQPSPAGAPARVAVSVRVDAGTMDESDGERGAARLTELFARARFREEASGDGPLAGALAKAGVRADQDFRVFTGFESTSLGITVPASDPALLAGVVGVMAEIVGSPSADDAQVPKMAAQLREQERSSMSVSMRANGELLPRMMPGSRVARRLPFGPGAVDERINAETVRAFHRRMYRASNLAVVIAGDVDERGAERVVREAFGRLPGGPRPAEADPGDVESPGPIALVFPDRGVSLDMIQVSTTRAPGPAVTTRSAFAEELTRRIAVEALRQRVAGAQAEAGGAGTNTRALSARLLRTLTLSALTASGKPGEALAMLRCVVGQLRGVSENGLTEAEVDAAREGIIAEARRRAQGEPALPPDALAEQYAESISMKRALLSAAQELELTERLARTVTGEMVSAAARSMFDPARTCVVAITPAGEPAPTEGELLGALKTQAAPVPACIARCGADPLGPAPAAQSGGGPAVASLELEPGAGVISCWLASGVRMHHRAMDSTPGQFRLALSLCGGVINETEKTRGLTGFVASALASPALGEASPPEVKAALDRLGLGLEAGVAPDAVTLTITAVASQAEGAFRFARALLTRGRLDRSAFERRVTVLTQEAAAVRTVPEQGVTELYFRGVYRPDPRLGAPSAEEIAGYTPESAGAYVADMLAHAPVEVAVVGDLPRARALELGALYLGTLAARERPSAGALEARRALAPQPGPVRRTAVLNSPDERAVVLEGFRGLDDEPGGVHAALEVGARVLAAELLPRLRDELGIATSVTAVNRPGEGFSGNGEFWVAASCAPERSEELGRELRAALSKLATNLSEEAVATSRQRAAADRAEQLANPAWWATRLATHALRGRPLRADIDAPATLLKVDAAQVRGVLATIMTEDRRVSLAVGAKAQ